MNRNSIVNIFKTKDMLTISEIKPILKELKLSRSGNKKELNDRLKNYYKLNTGNQDNRISRSRSMPSVLSNQGNRKKSMYQPKFRIQRNNFNNVIITSYCKKGKRDYMEDRICIRKNSDHIFAGIFDGHGGSLCADYLKSVLYRNIIKEKRNNRNFNKVFENAYIKTDYSFLKKNGNSGSTANCLFIDKKNNKFFVINTGDSRAFLCTKDNRIIPLSIDHKPSNRKEKQRILSNPGGFINDDRVNGILAMSRAFGDKKLKKWVIVNPDIVDGSFSNIKFIVLASDGLYDVMSNNEISKFINLQLVNNIRKDLIAVNLVNHAINDKHSYDNVSCIIIYA